MHSSDQLCTYCKSTYFALDVVFCLVQKVEYKGQVEGIVVRFEEAILIVNYGRSFGRDIITSWYSPPP